jgi:outer membrane protein OmpA-like peptidoglycan-associated protein
VRDGPKKGLSLSSRPRDALFAHVKREPPPQRSVELLACFAVGVVCLLALNLHFAPQAIAESAAAERPSSSSSSKPVPVSPSQTMAAAVDSSASAPAARIDPASRVPTIVARFESESTEPADLSGIRALAAAMIGDPEARVVLEGHSDLRGNDEYNHDISLGRANWVKARLVDLGVTGERVQTVGLGATRPLRHREGEAQAVNRRVEVRWISSSSLAPGEK